MKSKILFLSILLCSAVSVLQAANETLLFGQDEMRLVVNNRILAKVNDKAISVVDVMKKMDVLFYREFPQYTSSVQARYQFYKVNWKHVLGELISKELVLADAEENKLPVSNGDVRQEMESLFGPNIISNLDKINLSYDEAQKIVQGDITIRRMIYARVNAKAAKQVTPQVIRSTYEEFIQNPENIKPDIWKYNVISIRNKDTAIASEAAALAHQLLNEQVPLDQITVRIKENPLFEKTLISVSEEYNLEEKDISASYKEILSKMQPHTHSEPIAQNSRADTSTSLFRIFVLKDIQRGGAPSFNDMANQINDRLLEQAVAKETDAYLKRLRKHFHVQEDFLTQAGGEAFEPFSLK